jgi:hypothetical protein
MGSCLSAIGVGPLPRQGKYARATTRDLVIVDAPADAGGVFAGASPAIADQDLSSWSLTTSPGGYAITSQQDGGFSIASGGDTSRQTFSVDHYDRTLLRWTGDTTFYVNNQAPTVGDPTEVAVFVYPLNQAIDPEDDESLASDFEGDELTVTDIDSLPTGLTRGGNTVTGTPTVKGIYHTTTRWTDIAGDYVEGDITRLVGTITVPDVVGLSQSAAEDEIEGNYLSAVVTTAYSDTVAEGEVISQDPAASTEADPFDDVTITVSLGEEPEEEVTDDTIGGIQGRRRRRYFVEIDGQSFEVRTQAQAVEVLNRAKEVAVSHAEQMAKAAVRTARPTGKKPVKLATPKINSPNPELKSAVSEARKAINALYRKASMEAEIAYLMAQQEQDEEETILLLM